MQNELAGEIQLAIDVEAEMRKHGRKSSGKSSFDDSKLQRLMSVLLPALPSRHTHSSNWNQPAPSALSSKPHQRSYKSREKFSSVWRPGLGAWRPKQKFMSSKAATQRYHNPALARKHHVKRPFTWAATFGAWLPGRRKPRWNQINPANPLHDKPRGAKSASVWHLLIPLRPENEKSSTESRAKSPMKASAEPTFPATPREAAPPHAPSRDRAGSRDLVAADDVSAMVRAGSVRPPVPLLLLLKSAGRRLMGRQVRVGSRDRAAAAGHRRNVADGDGQDKVDENWAGFLQVRAGRGRRSVVDKTAAAAVASGQLRTGRASSRRTRDNDDDDDDDDYDDEKDDVEAADDVDLDRRDSDDDDDDDDDEDDEELQALLLSFTYLLSLSLMVRPNIHRVK